MLALLGSRDIFHQLCGFTISQAVERQQTLYPFGVGQLEHAEELSFECAVLTLCRRVPQQPYNAAGGGGIQCRDDMEVLCIIHGDSLKVKLHLEVLEPGISAAIIEAAR